LLLFCCGLYCVLSLPSRAVSEPILLDPDDFAPYVENFNAMEDEPVINVIPNAEAWNWMVTEIPFFHCPSKRFEEIYYFRWWTYRKHIKGTPDGLVLTEFIQPVRHAGEHNTISCAFGHHLAEGRWLRGQHVLDDYTRFWFRSGDNGTAAQHFHKYSSWAAAAIYDRYLVTGDSELPLELLDDLRDDYQKWESERRTEEGLFWQHDVQDGMEESISGGRRAKNVRPTINSYMVANGRAIARIAMMAGRRDLADELNAKSEKLHAAMIDTMWDPDAKFFKVQLEDGRLSDAREAIGFIPWMFNLAGLEHAEAWLQIKDADGFAAPWGITTAERRHPEFRTRGTGTCEWDGAVWPFATSQTLNGLARVIREHEQPYVTRRDYFDHLLTYARAHQSNGNAYIGEYHDEVNGRWLITGPKAERGRYYNHSTFNDLVISGLVGIVPREDNLLEVDPLIPADAWNWFCLDGVPYHGHNLTIIWDRTGRRYGRGAGFSAWANGRQLASSPTLGRLSIALPANPEH
jgi:hypothetical protein